MGKGKRIIIGDCITENGPVPGALWIFSADGQKKKMKKQEKLFEESAVNAEKAREDENTVLEKMQISQKIWYLPLHLPLRRQRNENLRMSLYHRPQKEQKQKQIRYI